MAEITQSLKDDILSAARKLTGVRRREYLAEMAIKYCVGSAHCAERLFGWGRAAVETGLGERAHRDSLPGQLPCPRASQDRRRQPRTDRTDTRVGRSREPSRPQVANTAGVHTNHGQGGSPTPGCQLRDARARRADRVGHLESFGLSVAACPQDRAQKKIPETDAIFTHLREVHAQAQHDPATLRISIDTKAKVKIGAFSRGGRTRGPEPVQAADHDMHPDAVLTPAGILEIEANQLSVIFGNSRDTSDFVADCLEQWWTNRHTRYPDVRRLLIDLDNGPEIASSRTQFMKRLVEFSDRHSLTLELAYYPPYHSKYNPIERCWGILRTTGTVEYWHRSQPHWPGRGR